VGTAVAGSVVRVGEGGEVVRDVVACGVPPGVPRGDGITMPVAVVVALAGALAFVVTAFGSVILGAGSGAAVVERDAGVEIGDGVAGLAPTPRVASIATGLTGVRAGPIGGVVPSVREVAPSPPGDGGVAGTLTVSRGVGADDSSVGPGDATPIVVVAVEGTGGGTVGLLLSPVASGTGVTSTSPGMNR